jgi:hypothetical protein
MHRRLCLRASDGERKGGWQMFTGSYVQVWYPSGRRWVTIAVSDHRAIAAGFAAAAFRERRGSRGELPRQVRVVSAAQLVYEGGEQEVRIADADVIRGAKWAAYDGGGRLRSSRALRKTLHRLLTPGAPVLV